MDLDKLRGDKNNSETIAFRLPTDLKQELLDVCDYHRLSVGKVMRELVTVFVTEAKDAENVDIQRN